MKKFLSLIASFAVSVSALSIIAYAEGKDITLCEGISNITNDSKRTVEYEIDNNTNYITYDFNNSKQALGFEKEVQNRDRSGNTAPVAGLTNMVANPNTLVNGSISTETIMYWLWNDGTTEYTYDPDGDEITDYYVDGINNYILGNVTMGDEVVGFATKITVAAQHELLFQVRDENGAYSNVVHLTFAVEPYDGNTRPICSITPSTQNPVENANVIFDWSNSYDPDGNSLTGVQVRVYDSTNTYETINSSSDYYVGMSNTGITLSFSEEGTYAVCISLCDSNNAWSDWNRTLVYVREDVPYYFNNLTLTTPDPNNSYPTQYVWCDYETSIDYATQTNNAEGLYDLLSSRNIPTSLQNRRFLATNWSLSGYVKNANGSPLSNMPVEISVPMFNVEFEVQATTDETGYFNYECTLDRWYAGWYPKYNNANPNRPIHDINYMGEITKWCRYNMYTTTTWMIASTMYVSCDAVQSNVSYSVVANAGYALKEYLGDRWYRTFYEGDGAVWIDTF